MKAFIFYSLSNLFRKQITIITHWSHSNDLYLYISWWFINLFINANYLPWRSHYMASQYCVFSSDLQGNFSVKILHHTGDIYMASLQCVLPVKFSQCKLTFPWRDNLTQHMKKHNDEKPSHWIHCVMAFSIKLITLKIQ